MGNELQGMGLNIAICDDEQIIREQIKELIEKEIPGVCTGLYETGDALLAAGENGSWKRTAFSILRAGGRRWRYTPRGFGIALVGAAARRRWTGRGFG